MCKNLYDCYETVCSKPTASSHQTSCFDNPYLDILNALPIPPCGLEESVLQVMCSHAVRSLQQINPRKPSGGRVDHPEFWDAVLTELDDGYTDILNTSLAKVVVSCHFYWFSKSSAEPPWTTKWRGLAWVLKFTVILFKHTGLKRKGNYVF